MLNMLVNLADNKYLEMIYIYVFKYYHIKLDLLPLTYLNVI